MEKFSLLYTNITMKWNTMISCRGKFCKNSVNEDILLFKNDFKKLA